MVKQFGAAAAALVLVVGALFVRGTFDSGESGRGGTDAGELADRGAGDPVCARDFDELCSVSLISERSQRAGAIADELLAARSPADLTADTWILPRAWAELVIDERARLGRQPLFSIDGDVLASSPIVVAIWSDRVEQVRAGCDGPMWVCLATKADTLLTAGDRVRTGMADVDAATGLVVAAQQASALLGRTDFAANDFDAAFRRAAADFAAGQQASPLEVMRTRGPGAVTAVGVARVDAPAVSSNFGEITLIDDGPTARVDVVVLVADGGGLAGDLRDRLTDTLVGSGWDAAVDGDAGLPAGGVLAAIRTLWDDNR